MPPEKLYAKSNEKDENVTEFINHIREHRIIWDTTVPDHHIKDKFRAAWFKVSRAAGYSRADRARFHWQRLKEKFRTIWTHYIRNPNTVITWPYFEEMKFLKETTASNDKADSVTESDDDVTSSIRCSSSPFTRSKRKLESEESSNDEEADSINNKEDIDKIDGDYLFLVSLLPTFQKLNTISKMQLRMKIQGLLVKEIHKQLKLSNTDKDILAQ